MRLRSLFFLFALLWALPACQPGAAGADQTTIDDPRDGATLPLAQVRINVHAEDPAGLATIQITINGQTLQTSSLQGASTRTSAYMSSVWTPTQDGQYVIEATAVDLQGEKGPVARVNVTIAGTASSSSAQSASPQSPAFVSTVPAAAPPVGDSNSSAAPTPTPAPVRLSGAVTPTGHAPPRLTAPINTDLVQCASIDLSWQAPANITATAYDIELQKIVGKEPITAKTWQDVADTHVSFNPECNILYRWRVRAKTGATGMDWSDYEQFRSGPPTGK